MAGKAEAKPDCDELSLSQIERRARKLLVFANAKAGTCEEDRERINKVLYESSKDSAYFKNEARKAELNRSRIQRIRKRVLGGQSSMLQIREASLEKRLSSLRGRLNLFHTWVHVDMDMFFAAVEMRDNPSLRGKPVAVGGIGMISTANYKARTFGVRSAMPGFVAKKLCPQLVFVKTHFEKYKRVAEQVRAILSVYDPGFVAMSLDEAALDVTQYIRNHHAALRAELREREAKASAGGPDALSNAKEYECTDGSSGSCETQTHAGLQCEFAGQSEAECLESGRLGALIADKIRSAIRDKTQLTASAGVGPSRTLAKICSDLNKPDGLFHLPTRRDLVFSFLNGLNVRKLPGVGKVLEGTLNELDIQTCADLTNASGAAMVLGCLTPKTSEWLLKAATGARPCPCGKRGPSERKGIGNERTFRDTSDPVRLRTRCADLCTMVSGRMRKIHTKGKVLTVKLKTSKFAVISRSVTLERHMNDPNAMTEAAIALLNTELSKAARLKKPLVLRLMGIRMANLLKQPKSEGGLAAAAPFVRTSPSRAPAKRPAQTEDSSPKPSARKRKRTITRQQSITRHTKPVSQLPQLPAPQPDPPNPTPAPGTIRDFFALSSSKEPRLARSEQSLRRPRHHVSPSRYLSQIDPAVLNELPPAIQHNIMQDLRARASRSSPKRPKGVEKYFTTRPVP